MEKAYDVNGNLQSDYKIVREVLALTKVVWDEYETALLIDTFWRIEKTPNRKQELIIGLSNALRQRAINAGKTIDEKFRNVNGISMQLSSIAHSFFSERPSLSSSVMFDKMVALYKTDRTSFEKILAKAKILIDGGQKMGMSTESNLKFEEWLFKVKYKKYTYQQLKSALEDANRYAIERKLSKVNLFSIIDPLQFSAVMSKIQGMRFFRIMHPHTSRYLDSAAVLYKKYLYYIQKAKAAETQPSPKLESKPTVEVETINEAVVLKDIPYLLNQYFQYGFKIDSIREMLKLRQLAEVEGVNLTEDDEKLKADILTAGTLIDGKVFAKTDDLAPELCGIVKTITDSGVAVVYYESLLEQQNDWMASHFITSEAMLKELLQGNLEGFSFSKKFMAVGDKKTEKQAVTDEIKRVWGDNQTCSVDELNQRLPYIPSGNILRTIFGNYNFAWVSEGVYLLVDRFIITEDEEEAILEYVESSCKDKGFASLSDVPKESIEEQNYELSQSAILSAIYSKVLLGRYELKGKILTRDNPDLDAVALLKKTVEGYDNYSFSELTERVVELTGSTNRQFAFQALYDCMVRIGINEYVADRFVSFDVNEIDRILSDIIAKHFCSIKDITSFALFPVCGYPWNAYLLESYCYKYSNKYSLRVLNFNDKNAGIIAEKCFDKSYIEMLAIATADSDVELNAESVGQYLFETGYMAKRKYGRLDEIVEKARELREGI